MPKSGGSPPRARRTRPAKSPRSGAVTRIDAACRQAVAGRVAIRELAGWAGQLGASEVEFRLLWLLARRTQAADNAASLDQASLAEQLVVSAAQVSGVVERLGAANYIEHVRRLGDRRRHAWRITKSGEALIGNVVAVVSAQLDGPAAAQTPRSPNRPDAAREVA